MCRHVVLLAFSVVAVAATPALAQTGPGNPNNVWQNGTQPVPDLNVSRQSPGAQPAAASGPVGTQSQGSWPTWYQQPIGTPVGGGTLVTGITVGTYFDDNVFASHSSPMSDWAFFERPEFSWYKQGSNYTVTLDGNIEGREYATFTSENQINGGLGASFTVMPDNDTQIVGGARYIHAHLDRGASETVITTAAGSQLLSTTFANPVAYDEGLESIALNKRYGRWWTSIGAAGLEINYQNPTIGSITGVNPFSGTVVDLSYADGAIGSVNGRLGYVVSPNTSVFGEVAGNTRDWQVGYFDSTGYRAVVGMLFEPGNGARLKGEFWAGYMDQTYNGATMQTISTFTYGLNLAVLVTDNVTAVFQGSREAKEAALGLAALPSGALGASAPTCTADTAVCVSTIESTIGGRFDFHVAPKVVLGAGVTYLHDEYEGMLAFGRTDDTVSPLASVKYLWSQNLTLGFDYRNVAFTSQGGTAPIGFTSVNALSYNRNVYMLSANARW